MKKLVSLPFVMFFLAISSPQACAEEEQPWTHPEVLQAAQAIGMNSDQRDKFRLAVREFLRGFESDARRLFNRRNLDDMPRRIASKRRVRARAMDKRMGEFLSEEQLDGYEIYRDLLLEKMDENAKKRQRR